MPSSSELIEQISQGNRDTQLGRLYGLQPQEIARQRTRYCAALRCFERYYGRARQVRVFSAPGRTEFGGNHTDHQNGIALAAAVNLDIIAVMSKSENTLVRVKSYGFDKLDVVDLRAAGSQPAESTHSASLIRGIAKQLERRGGTAGGFDAYTTSDVLRGSGLSSSAAFETVIAAILNETYNAGRFTPLELAQVSQYAENTYFGKPSGLLDPLACTIGGAICADFCSPGQPVVARVEVDLKQEGYCLCVTDTRGSHSELTEEFADIRREMECVAQYFGKSVLRQVAKADVWAALPALRRACGDRAVLRALHFYEECRRAKQEYQCLKEKDFSGFLRLAEESGHACFQYNQNAFCSTIPQAQAIPLALAISHRILQKKGASRLQGGGFAGTIQAFVPTIQMERYRTAMEQVFGTGCCRALCVRSIGCAEVFA